MNNFKINELKLLEFTGGVIISFISELTGKKVFNPDGQKIGKIKDLIVSSNDRYPLVVAVVITADKTNKNIPWNYIDTINDDLKLNMDLEDINEYKLNENDIKLVNILDKQIVDTNDKKIERVNDIELSKIDGKYQLIGLGIGFKGIAKRIGIDNILKDLKINIPDEYITWKDIDFSKSDGYNLKLKVPDERLKKLHPSDIAEIIHELNDKDLSTILHSLDDDIAASVLEEISSNRQICLLDGMDNEKTANILNKMSPDSATDLLGCLSKDRADEFLNLMNTKKADDIRKLLDYPPDTAGGLMTTEFAVINDDSTAQELLNHLRNIVKDIRFIYYVYLVSKNGILTGVASLKDIIFADPDKQANEFMKTDLITVNELENQNEVARKIAKYNLLAIPVINDRNEIKGIVTFDDILDVTLPSQWKDKIPKIE